MQEALPNSHWIPRWKYSGIRPREPYALLLSSFLSLAAARPTSSLRPETSSLYPNGISLDKRMDHLRRVTLGGHFRAIRHAGPMPHRPPPARRAGRAGGAARRLDSCGEVITCDSGRWAATRPPRAG